MGVSEHTQRGKWSQPGVPQRGWTCVDVDDLGEPSQLCEMCESVDIRFVHHMQHPDYSDILAVGCVCAEHMEQDYVRPKEREKRLRSAASRRRTWANRQWRVSERGNPYLNSEGFNLTVFSRGSRWTVSVANRANGNSRIGVKTYESMETAKAAALNALLWAKEHLS